MPQLQSSSAFCCVCCLLCCFQVYEGVAAMYSRDFKRAAELLLDSIATFTT
jgi:hypothetical protein